MFPAQIRSLLPAALLLPVLSAAPAAAAPGAWLAPAPEALPLVTVRWEDPEQREVFVVQGERYECRVATHPARILSLRAGGRDLLGPEGMAFGFEDARGARYITVPRDVTPDWMTWQGQGYKPAPSSRARMNVWSAGPYYWDAHLLDIPLMTAQAVDSLGARPEKPALKAWSFDKGAEGWAALNHCALAPGEGALAIALDGADPYLESPPIAVAGPVVVSLRMRSAHGGGGALYWYAEDETGYSGTKVKTFATVGDGEWHTYRVALDERARVRRLRFDPPGQSGRVELDAIRLDAPSPTDPALQPARGEVIFHAHPDHLRIDVRAEPAPGMAAPLRAFLSAPGLRGSVATAAGRPILTLGEGAAALLGPAGTTCELPRGWLASPAQGARPGAVWVIWPLAARGSAEEALSGDLAPLPASSFAVDEGWCEGYDPASGLYLLHAAANRGAFSFEAAYKNPSRRLRVGVRVANDARPRRVVVRCLTGVGNLEAAVLADPYGFPLPVPAFVAKNFGGEREEPDDSAFGDSHFPLELAPRERREFQVLHLFQDWGNHPLKQVSSIRFFHIYWHLSTGASETTCFTHNWMPSGDRIFHIPDFRPMSGEMWAGQPQHGVGQWPGFLQCNGGKVRLVYDATTFESISPCLASFRMFFHTSDNAATARVDVMEIPQRDETRTFLRLRYDWGRPVTIEGDARLSFRWLNVNERQGADQVVWTGADGKTQVRPAAPGAPVLLAEPLCKESPVIGAHGRAEGEDYHSLVLVRRFEARLGGREVDQAVASALFTPRGGDYWLTVPEEKLQLQAGDYIEAEVMLMPHGDPAPPELKPERERERFGAAGPRVDDVKVGEKISDFPAVVRAADEVAQFTLKGGFDLMPVVVEAFRAWGVPLLWREGVWQDQQVRGGDGYQVQPDGGGGYRFVFVYPTRKGQEHPLLVTRASCSTGVARVHDVNGCVALEAPRAGEWALKAPALFAPGRNEVTAGGAAIAFTGSGARVRQVPVGVSLPSGRATVEIASWNEAGAALQTDGAALTLSFGQLAPGAAYRVRVDGKETIETSKGGSLSVELPAGRHRVEVGRK